MKGIRIVTAAALTLAIAGLAAAQSNQPTPGSAGNGQVGTGAVTLPQLATSAATSSSASTATTTAGATAGAGSGGGAGSGSARAGGAASSGTGGGTGGVEMLCLPGNSSTTQPFFTGTELFCGP